MKKNKISKLSLGGETIKRLTNDRLREAVGGERFTSAFGCPSAFATECCNIETMDCTRLCPA